ncbi:hypothetical protein CHUAL_000248 [Chamberlinius hualienensis]
MDGDNSFDSLVPELVGTNYGEWSKKLKCILEYKGLWKYVSRTLKRSGNEIELAKWDEGDAKAIALIAVTVGGPYLDDVMDSRTSHEAWTKLLDMFRPKSMIRTVALIKELCWDTYKEDEEDLYSYLNRRTSALSELGESFGAMNEIHKCGFLLSGLSSNWQPVIQTIAFWRPEETTMPRVIKELMIEASWRSSEKKRISANIYGSESSMAIRGNAISVKEGKHPSQSNAAPTNKREKSEVKDGEIGEKLIASQASSDTMIDEAPELILFEEIVQNSNVNSGTSVVENEDQTVTDTPITNDNKQLSYSKDQWSPTNQEGKKQYSREFLMQMRYQELSIKKLDGLPDLEVIKDYIVNDICDKPRTGTVVNDFLPNFINNNNQSRIKRKIRRDAQMLAKKITD